MSDALGYYSVLEVSENADLDTIKTKYRDLAKYWHPDRNNAEGALERFQKISEAWDVLSDEDKRQNYDLLSSVYGAHNYPDIENIVPYGEGNSDIKAITIKSVRGWILNYRETSDCIISDYKQALLLQMKMAILNWLEGWWHPKAFLKNIQAIRHNLKHPISKMETKRALIHNLVYYKLHGNIKQSKIFALKVWPYADNRLKGILLKILSPDNPSTFNFKEWNFLNLRLVQLIIPIILALGILVPSGSRFVSETELWNWIAHKKEIKYYQEVKFTAGDRGVDDVVVGKVLSIPVDRSDISRLYHLQNDANVMYGPGDDFDVLKTLKSGTTVRLTGVTPDNVWSRIMIDNGEMGFVRTVNIVSGIGAEIPYGSQIFQE